MHLFESELKVDITYCRNEDKPSRIHFYGERLFSLLIVQKVQKKLFPYNPQNLYFIKKNLEELQESLVKAANLAENILLMLIRTAFHNFKICAVWPKPAILCKKSPALFCGKFKAQPFLMDCSRN